MKLTQRIALTICRELWQWLADNPTKGKEDWPGWEQYKKYVKRPSTSIGLPTYSFICHCPCCEYVFQTNNPCPLTNYAWEGKYRTSQYCFSALSPCVQKDSPYLEWNKLPRKPRSPKTRALKTKYALQIVAACDKALQDL